MMMDKSSIEKYKRDRTSVLMQAVLYSLADLTEKQREKILEDGTPEEVVDYCKDVYDKEFDLHVETLGVSGADEIARHEALGIFQSFDENDE